LFLRPRIGGRFTAKTEEEKQRAAEEKQKRLELKRQARLAKKLAKQQTKKRASPSAPPASSSATTSTLSAASTSASSSADSVHLQDFFSKAFAALSPATVTGVLAALLPTIPPLQRDAFLSMLREGRGVAATDLQQQATRYVTESLSALLTAAALGGSAPAGHSSVSISAPVASSSASSSAASSSSLPSK